MTLFIITGKIGSGKTLILTILGYMMATKYHENIYANYFLKFPYKQLDISNLYKIGRRAIVLLDEGYIWIDARVSSSNQNRVASYTQNQSRKRHIHILITTQLFSQLDLRYRQQCDGIIDCSCTYYITNDEIYTDAFMYDIYDNDGELLHEWMIPAVSAIPFFDLYDTYEIVEIPSKIDDASFDFLPKSDIRLLVDTHLPKIKQITSPNNPTKRDIKKYLFENDITTKLSDYIELYV